MLKRFVPAFAGFVVVFAIVMGGAWVWRGGGADRVAVAPADAQTLALGKKLYGDHCGSCHGLDLEGQPNWRTPTASGVLPAPPHDETGHTWHHADAAIFDYTKRGGAAVVGGSFKSAMPGFGEMLSDAQIWAVIAYIKSHWPAEIRERQAARNQPK